MSEPPSASGPTNERSIAFGPTSGKFSGWFGLVVAVSLAAETFRDGLTSGEAPVMLGALLIAALAWTVMLRPRVVLHPADVELRNFLRDRHVPYGLIDAVDVKTVTVLYVGAAKYLGVAVGRKVKMILRESMPLKEPDPTKKTHPGAIPASGNLHGDNTGDYVAERIRQARDLARVSGPATGEVRTTYAWIEIALLAVLVVALVVSLLL